MSKTRIPSFTAEASLHQYKECEYVIPAQGTTNSAGDFDTCYDDCMENTCKKEKQISDKVGGGNAFVAYINCLDGIEDRCYNQCLQAAPPQGQQPGVGGGQQPGI